MKGIEMDSAKRRPVGGYSVEHIQRDGGTHTEGRGKVIYVWRVKKVYISQKRKTVSAAVHSGIGEGEKNDAPEDNNEGYGAGTACRMVGKRVVWWMDMAACADSV